MVAKIKDRCHPTILVGTKAVSAALDHGDGPGDEVIMSVVVVDCVIEHDGIVTIVAQNALLDVLKAALSLIFHPTDIGQVIVAITFPVCMVLLRHECGIVTILW